MEEIFCENHSFDGKSEQKRLDKDREEMVNKARTIRRFITQIKAGADVLTEWDEDLWAATVDHMTVGTDGSMTFCFKNGREITE